MDVGRASLEAGFEEVQRVADYDAYGAGDVAGPEVGGHCMSSMWLRKDREVRIECSIVYSSEVG
jgi:hypothetical protein